MLKVTNMDLNANTLEKIAKRVMKDRNMQVVDRFTPVVSEYTVNISPKHRYIFTLEEDKFTTLEQVKTSKGWKNQTQSVHYENSLEQLENAFGIAIGFLKDAYKSVR